MAGVMVTSTASVSDPPVQASGGLLVRGTAKHSTGSQTVAVFTDPGGPEAIGSYTAAINWGNGKNSSGTITVINGVFYVSGSNTYSKAGTYVVHVTITNDSGAPVVVNDTAQVSGRWPVLPPVGLQLGHGKTLGGGGTPSGGNGIPGLFTPTLGDGQGAAGEEPSSPALPAMDKLASDSGVSIVSLAVLADVPPTWAASVPKVAHQARQAADRLLLPAALGPELLAQDEVWSLLGRHFFMWTVDDWTLPT
jgi:hypothetical protein